MQHVICIGVLKTRKGNEFNVVAKILRVAAKGSSEEEIMDRCKLDRMALENYLSALADLELLRVEEEGENFYRTTSMGLEFLRFYHGLRWVLGRKDFDFLLINILTRLKTDKHPYYVR